MGKERGTGGFLIMKRPILLSSRIVRTRRVRERHTACAGYGRGGHTACAGYDAGYTLVEILVATTLSLMLLGAVITIFANVSQSVGESRSMLEAAEQLRLASTRLQQDLAGVTVTMNPPRNPANNEGYFEYIEGPITATTASSVAQNTNATPATPDTTVGDFDDILMFTTRSTGQPFVGKVPTTVNPTGAIQSDVAEVAWFVRGRTLHRHVLLVAPAANLAGAVPAGFYANYDISARVQGGTVVANTLGDLTRRECRFAHVGSFPYDVGASWRWTAGGYTFPTLPTLNECSVSGSWLPAVPGSPLTLPSGASLDFWTNNANCRIADNAMATGSRVADDVILNNVIGFDVKVWDPVAGSYVDLGTGTGTGRFSGTYTPSTRWAVDRRNANNDLQYPTYDTWSTHYETAGTSTGDTGAGRATNGIDDAGSSGSPNGIVDDADELLTSPPYPYPLRGIQVKIRIFEPDSRQVREVTVVQDFLPQ
jgi:type II secretory pathway component PulJ